MASTVVEWVNEVSIIPLKHKDKRPLVDWKPFQERKPTKDEREGWGLEYQNMNWGLVCGKVSGVVVLDFDGPEGRALLEKHGYDRDPYAPGQPPRCVTPNGTHLYFAYPSDPEQAAKVRNWVRRAPGLDIRADGGYVVIPPSVHPKGDKYRWAVPPWKAELPPLPDWFWAVLEEKASAEAQGAPTPTGAVTTGGTWREWLEQDCPKGTPGGRHGRALQIAGALLCTHTPAVTLSLLKSWNLAHCKPPLPEPELEKMVKDFSNRAPKEEKAKTPNIHVFTAAELSRSKPQERVVLIEPWFGGLDNVVIAGEGGIGKSVLALQLAASLVTGEPFLRFPVRERRRVMYVDIENGKDRAYWRQRRVLQEYGATPPDALGWAFVEDHIDLDSHDGRALLTRLTDGYEVVILDPFLPFFPRLKSENDNAEVRRVLDGMRVWSRENNKNIVVVDHMPMMGRKEQESGDRGSPRGASAKRDWYTVVCTLQRSGGDTVTLRFSKTRDCKRPEPVQLVMDGTFMREV